MIKEELGKFSAPWLLGIYSDLDTSSVDDCLNVLSTALEKLKVCPMSDVYVLKA